MRLKQLEQPHSLMQKLRFFVLRALLGQVPGPILALSCRGDFCGKYLARCYQQGLRQAREWSIGEVELFAAFVSSLNRCRF